MTDLKGNREGRLVCLLGLILTFGTLACYWPVRHFDFVNLDDPFYIYETRMVQRGLSWPGFVWAFKCVEGGNWHPLVWLSHMADCQLYGLKPGGHHVTNLLLHTGNALLLFLVLKSMTGAIWRSAFVAAIFAWHPMHVESVAWVSERKDVLSTLFFLFTIWAYASFSKAGGPRRKMLYVLALFLFALGLMCKPMLVTLPLVLLLLDYWPLQRVESAGRLVMEKLPFLALSMAASVLAVWTQQSVGAMTGTAPLPVRLENAVVSYATYLGRLFWPADMAMLYLYPARISIWQAGGALVVLGAVSWAVIREMKKRRYLAVGWFWYLGTLIPVIGLIQVGMQALADRYTYIPYIGLAVMISWGMTDLAQAWPRSRVALAWGAWLAMAGCLAVTCSQVKYWRNSITLNEHASKVTSGNYVALSNLGESLMDNGKLDEAVKRFQEVIRLKPNAPKPYNNLGKVYAVQEKLDDAMAMFSKAISLNPGQSEAHYNLGSACMHKGKTAEGIAEFKTALRLKPDDINAQKMLAEALIKTGKATEAIPYCKAVVEAEPEDAHAHFTLGWAWLATKRPEQALASYKEAVRLAPDKPQCLNALAWIYGTCPKAELRSGAERRASRHPGLPNHQTAEH